MFRIACLIAALLAALLLAGCDRAQESASSSKAASAAAPAPIRISETGPDPAAAMPGPAAALPGKAKLPRNGGKGAGPGDSTIPPYTDPQGRFEDMAGGARPGDSTAGPGAPATSSAALGADEQRLRRRDAYIAGLKQGAYSFNPPSPIKVNARIGVALWVDPVLEAAQLAEEMKKAFPTSAARVEAGATPWSPRMRATLSGPDFEITPVEGKDFNGVKDLSMIARTEWGWTLLPKLPGKKQLHLLLAVVLPPELGDPRELPALRRDVEVEVTLWWLVDHYWEKYWKWVLSGLGGALAAAIAWWWKKRFAGGAG